MVFSIDIGFQCQKLMLKPSTLTIIKKTSFDKAQHQKKTTRFVDQLTINQILLKLSSSVQKSKSILYYSTYIYSNWYVILVENVALLLFPLLLLLILMLLLLYLFFNILSGCFITIIATSVTLL